VNSWSLAINQDPTVTVSNSELYRMACQFQNANITIDEARLGFYRNWTLGKLTLLNTSITNEWLPRFSNCLAEVSNTTALVDLSGSNNISFRNSSLGWLKAFPGVMNTALQFQGTKVEMISSYFSSFYMCGEIDFSSGAYVSEWISSYITRNYNVIARYACGQLVSNANLSLKSRDGISVWNGTTDSLGQANFNVTFTDSNYTDTLRFEVLQEGFYNFTDSVSFLSSTPISINLTQRPLGDINEDHVVDIIDISIVAKAFSSELGHPNWDAIADVNNDEVIDILDISMVAVEFGKAV
jgi:hypothetical protein